MEKRKQMRKYENVQLREEVIVFLRRRCCFTYKIIGILYEISGSRVAQIYNKALRINKHKPGEV